MDGGWNRQQYPYPGTGQQPPYPGGANPYPYGGGGYDPRAGRGAGGYHTGGRDPRQPRQDRRQPPPQGYGTAPQQHPQGYATAPQPRRAHPGRGYDAPPRQRRYDQAQPPRQEPRQKYRPRHAQDDGRMPREEPKRDYRDRHPTQMHQLSTGQDPYGRKPRPHSREAPQPRQESPHRRRRRRRRGRHEDEPPTDYPEDDAAEQQRRRPTLPEPRQVPSQPLLDHPRQSLQRLQRERFSEPEETVPEPPQPDQEEYKFSAPPERLSVPEVPELPKMREPPTVGEEPSEADLFPQPFHQSSPPDSFPADNGQIFAGEPHFGGDTTDALGLHEPKPKSRFRKWLDKLVTPSPAKQFQEEAGEVDTGDMDSERDYTAIPDQQPPAVEVDKGPDNFPTEQNGQFFGGFPAETKFAEDYGEDREETDKVPVFKKFKNWLRRRKPSVPVTEDGGDIPDGLETVPYSAPVSSFPNGSSNGHLPLSRPVSMTSQPQLAPGDTLTRRKLSMLDIETIREKIEEDKQEGKAESVLADDVQSLVNSIIGDHSSPSDIPRNALGEPRRTFARESRRTKLLADPKVKLTGYKKWKYNRAKQWQKNKISIRSFLDNFTVWSSSFKDIEGHFGSSIVSYFTFVKWLLMVNLFVTLIILAVIVFPQEFLTPDTFQDSIHVVNFTQDSRVTSFHWEAENCSTKYDNTIAGLKNQSVWYKTIDFFQGTGWMEQTVLFIGYYFNKTVIFQEDHVHYNMPLAYLLCTAAYFAITLILMVNVAARGMKARLLTSGDKFYNTCNKVFCSWDYSLSERKAAQLKHRNLFREFTNDLEEQKRLQRSKTMTRVQKVKIYSIRVLVNLLVLALLGACGYLIFQVTSVWMPDLLLKSSVADNRILTLLVEFLPSITITVLNVLIPPVFQKVVIFEDYAPETEIRVTIARTVFLRLASVAFLVITLLIKITCNEPNYCGNCAVEVTECWETYFGQQFYKLILLDFIVVVGVTFFVEFPRKLLVRKFPKSKLLQLLGLQEFEIPQNVLDIVYSQTLCWIGGFFSPLVPAITVIKFFIYFYVKKLTLMKNCIPSSRPYRASRSNSFFMTVLMLSFVLCVVPIAYSVGRIPPTKGCGPFRIYSSSGFLMYNSVTDAISELHQVPQDILHFVGSYLFYVPMIIIMSLIIYYYQAMAAANKRLGELLREQLALEGKDKQFLLTMVNDALQRGDFANIS